MDGPRWLNRQGRRDCGGAPGPRWWLVGVGHYQRSSSPFSTWSWPKGVAWGGDLPRGVLRRWLWPEQCARWGVLLPQARQWWEHPPVVLQLVQDHEQLPLGLLLGFNCCVQWWIYLAWSSCSVLGFGSCGSKFGENRSLFIGLLVWTRRGLGVLQFLSINRTLIRLHLEDFWKETNSGWLRYRNQIPGWVSTG
jgi:hypothetical protein